MTINVDVIKEYAKTRTEIIELESKTNSLKSRLRDLEPQVIDNLHTNGLRRIDLTSPRVTVKIDQKFVGSVNDSDAFNANMKRHGFDAVVKESVNYQTLRRIVREWQEEHDEGFDENMIESKNEFGQGTGVFVPDWVGDSLTAYKMDKVSVQKAK